MAAREKVLKSHQMLYYSILVINLCNFKMLFNSVCISRLGNKNIFSREIIIFKAAEKISDSTSKEIFVIPCQEYNIHLFHS